MSFNVSEFIIQAEKPEPVVVDCPAPPAMTPEQEVQWCKDEEAKYTALAKAMHDRAEMAAETVRKSGGRVCGDYEVVPVKDAAYVDECELDKDVNLSAAYREYVRTQAKPSFSVAEFKRFAASVGQDLSRYIVTPDTIKGSQIRKLKGKPVIIQVVGE